MQDVFPYLWQTAALVNDLAEPGETAKKLFDGWDEFRALSLRLAHDERAYTAGELSNAVRCLDETIGLLTVLRDKLQQSGLSCERGDS